MPKRRRIGSDYVDRAPSVYSEEASIVAEVLACDLETLQITFVEVDTSIQRTVDPLTYFQDPSSLILCKTFLEEQTQTNVRLQQWMDDLEARIHLCLEQERFSQESEIICIDDDEDEPNESRPDIDDSREYICIEIEEDEEDETLVDKEDDQQEEPKEEEEEEEEKSPKSKSKSKTSFKVYMPTRDEMAFCCADCRCETTTTSIHTIQNGDDSLYHRLCCHKIANNNANPHSVFKKAGLWRCPVQLVDEQRTAALTVTSHKHTYDHQGNILYCNRELSRRLAQYQKEEECLFHISRFELQRKINTTQRQQQAFANADFEALPVDVLKTHPNYDAIQRDYQQIVQSIESSERNQQTEGNDDDNDPRTPATVLDFFAGIGSGTVALKRLGIAMKKVIHVEHDKVATHVHRFNHDNSYNSELEDDGIEHVCSPKFEHVEDDLDAFMKLHGPIDIVLGGPPCIDYSAVNAYRKGVHGEQGQYLQRLGKLVHAIRNHKLQRGHPLFFLAENVVLRDKDLDAISDSFGITPLEVDAHYYSPCRRKRHFFMNYPVDLDFTTVAASSEVTSCLEQGWLHPADAIAKRTGERLEEAARLRKANTFMASLMRIDDERMTVVKKSETGGFVGRSMMVVERERMMGFPEAYVSAPLVPLFEEVKDAMCKQYLPAVATPWTKEMDSKYHCISGDMPKLAFDDRPDSLAIKTLLAPPQPNNTKKVYFDREGYSKRLLGNAYSVVVAEILLQPLTRIYPTRRYFNFDYEYLWPNKLWTLPEVGANKSSEGPNAHPIGNINMGQNNPLLSAMEDEDRPVVV